MTKDNEKDASLHMAKHITDANSTQLIPSRPCLMQESFNGLANLKNCFIDTRQLQRQPQSQATQQTTTSQSQPTSEQNGSSGATNK